MTDSLITLRQTIAKNRRHNLFYDFIHQHPTYWPKTKKQPISNSTDINHTDIDLTISNSKTNVKATNT